MSDKFVITKPFNRNNAKATSDYLHNKTDPDHINTLILDELNYKSEAFNKIGADWKILDDYEDVMKCKRHAKEFILPLPMETMAKDGSTYSKKHFDRAVDVFISNLSKEIGIEKDNLIWEAQAHLNIKTSKKPENPHIHFIVYEREITFERSFETYDRNYWHDGKRPFNNKELDNQFLMADDKEAFLNSLKAEKNIVLSHKKGEVKVDKDGKPKEKAFDITFSNKNREINRWQTLENLRMTFQKEFSSWTPQHDYHIGRLPERVQGFKFTKAMEHAHPEKATLIKEVNNNIRLLNEEIAKVDEPKRRRAYRDEAQEKVKEKKEEMKHKPLDRQMELLNQVADFTRDFKKRVIDFLQRAKEKITWWTQFNIYEEPNAIYKKEDKGSLFKLYEFNLRENGVKYLGEFARSNDPKMDVVRAAGFEDRYAPLFEPTKASEINRVDGLLDIEPKIEPEREISRGRGMRF